MKQAILALSLFAMTPWAGAAPAVFENPRRIVHDGTYLYALRAGDFNGDAKPDFVMLLKSATTQQYRLSVRLGNGDGTFGSAIDTPLGNAYTIDVADLDGNGMSDVVVAWNAMPASNTASFKAYLSSGNGLFSSAATATASMSPCQAWAGFALGEMTGDSHADIVMCNGLVLPGAGDGTFGAAAGPAVAFEGEEVHLLDANGDGHNDVLLRSSTSARLLAGNGNGTFASAGFIAAGGPLATADLDGNGRDDLTFFVATSRMVRFATGSGASVSYGEAVTAGRIAHSDTRSLATGDFNGDARPDVVAGYEGQLHVWLTEAGGGAGAVAAYSAGSSAYHLATGDFDSDGHLDLLAAGISDMVPPFTASELFTVTLLRGVGDGTFHAPDVYPLLSGSGADQFHGLAGVRLDDVTGDGILDAITTSGRDIAVLPGAGNGTFGAAVLTAGTSGDFIRSALFGDYDGDGRDDVLVTAGDRVQCWLANGDGTYRQSAQLNGVAVDYGAAPGDFDGDGKLDFAISEQYGISLHRGRGDGTFDAPVFTQTTANVLSLVLAAADVNGDGRDDVVGDNFTFLGGVAGGFTYVSHGVWPSWPPAAVADFDADGKADVVKFSPPGLPQMYVQHGLGDGTFGPARVISIGSPASLPSALGVVADFDGDGSNDFALSGTVFLGDGAGSFDGYARFRGFGVACAAAGDVDGNGSPDLVLLANHALTVARTRTTEALDLPLGLALQNPPASTPAASAVTIKAATSGGTAFAPAGAAIVSLSGVVIGFAEVRADIAEVAIQPPAGGSHTLAVRYGGDELYAAGSAHAVPIEITRANARIFAATIPDYPSSSDSTSVDVLVGGSFLLPDPTGTVTILVDGIERSSGLAPEFTAVLGSLSPGTRKFLYRYSGDSVYLPVEKEYEVEVADGPPPTSATSFYMVTPCRVVDTRDPNASHGGPQLAAQGVRWFSMTGRCGIPQGAKALALNVTAVNPAGVGFLTLYPAGSSLPGTSTMNYRTGRTRANSAIMRLSAAGAMNVANNGSPVHVIIDVTGYFQ